jgi:outer membrane lipoprotein-sorting protein
MSPRITRRRAGLGLAASALGLGLARADAATDPAIDQVRDFLARITTLRARFMQVGPEGDLAQGVVYVARPSRMRFEYEEPAGLLLVSNGDDFKIYDPDIRKVTVVPLEDTPINLILGETIDFGTAIDVLDLKRGAGVIELTVADPEARGSGTLTVVFTEKPFELRQWFVVDAQGLTTRVTLLDAQYGLALDDSLFDIAAEPISSGKKN